MDFEPFSGEHWMRRIWIGVASAAALATAVSAGLAAAAEPSARAIAPMDPQKVHAEGGAHLTNDAAARIADTLIATSATGGINISAKDLRIGAPIPGDVNLTPLPAAIGDLVPEYRDYNYALTGDQIAIVRPSTRQVVEVINTGGGAKKSGE